MNMPENLYTEPDEVSLEVKTFAYLLGQLDAASSLSPGTVTGLYLIGNMISENVNAMIKDFEDRNDHLRAELKALREEK